MSPTDWILEAEGITKTYKSTEDGTPFTVLDNTSIQLAKGTVTAIVGSSGSGKSTLLHIVGGLDTPDKGLVKWQNRPIHAMKADELATFRNRFAGFVFQFHHLLPEFSALENVAMPALIGGMPQKEAYEKATALLIRFGINHRSNNRPTQLSGGEQQRVSMARALMNTPRLLLADEPTGNLDEENTSIILDFIYELTSTDQIAVLLITHEEEIAERADQVFEMKNGMLSPLRSFDKS
ncbi:MAG: ABC transporter ATP-binding protein [Bacteroidota bacterium]